MMESIKKILKKAPIIRRIIRERDESRKIAETLQQENTKLQQENVKLRQDLEKREQDLERYRRYDDYFKFFPPGHFYSPIPDFKEVLANRDRIWGKMPDKIDGIDLNLEEQIELIKEFGRYYEQLPFANNHREGLRYYYQNPAYVNGDAVILYSLIRHCKPKRIIEAGCGFSSCVILDTNELFFNFQIQCTFIDPYPDLLEKLMKKEDHSRVKIVPRMLQDVEPELFSQLEENDLLVIDSTHVSKIDSDVNFIFNTILPNLKKGVWVHFHDIAYPFEYPIGWIEEGRAWNEQYMLRAFLQFNSDFKIKLFNTYLGLFQADLLKKNLPAMFDNMGGSIWIQRVK